MFFRLFAVRFWVYLPAQIQKRISSLFSFLFKTSFSRLFIAPYCIFFGLNQDYLSQFESETTAESSYSSYQDFFKRKYKTGALQIQNSMIWPCEGYVCDWGLLDQNKVIMVKGSAVQATQIFTQAHHRQAELSSKYLVNIFLHNHNYHRLHAPTDLVVTSIERIPGSLQFLRPWFYSREQVSQPAILNERVTITFQDIKAQTWFMTMVGGFGVGTIQLEDQVRVGTIFKVGEEMAHFNLGSTVCIASPYPLDINQYLQTVSVGQPLPIIAHQDKNNDRILIKQFNWLSGHNQDA